MNKKKIKILTRGAIRVKGFINGPVLTPYYEDLNTIFSMIVAGVHIVEVLEDGSEVRLTTANLTEVNTPEQSEPKTESKPQVPVITEKEPEVKNEEVVKAKVNEPDTVIINEAINEVINETEELVEEIEETEPKREPDFNRMNKHNKKKYNKNN